MFESDRDGFMKCITGTEAEMGAGKAFIGFMCETKAFKDAVIDEYGEQGWAPFEQSGGAKISLNTTDNRAELDKVQWKIDGDKAEGKMPGEDKTFHLTRKDGRWRIEAKDILTGGDDMAKFTRTWKAMADAIREAKGRVGKPGVTPQSLDLELGKAIMSALMGG